MYKIAIIGFGNHVKKNILPAFSRMGDVEVDAVYVRDVSKYVDDANTHDCVLRSIDEAIDSAVKWVYIATPIATHYELASRYLGEGKHVICEKPLTEDYAKTLELLKIAKDADRRLYEVCMYQYHKQFLHLQNTVKSSGEEIKSLSTAFAIPHLNPDDIRYQKELCGGALLDVGYYPLSLITALFGEPKELQFAKYSDPGYDVDLRGVATLVYEGHYCIAEWGMGLPYKNEATIQSETFASTYMRAFSKPHTLDASANIFNCDGLETLEIGSDDHFVNMFRSFLAESPAHGTASCGVDVVLAKVLSQVKQAAL